MNNFDFAIIQLNGLIAGMESHSSIPIQVSELKMMKMLLTAGDKPQALTPLQEKPLPVTFQPPVRAVPMALFPTMGSLQSVVELGMSQLPINTSNAIVSLLMVYHNTLLQEVKNVPAVD